MQRSARDVIGRRGRRRSGMARSKRVAKTVRPGGAKDRSTMRTERARLLAAAVLRNGCQERAAFATHRVRPDRFGRPHAYVRAQAARRPEARSSTALEAHAPIDRA